MAKLTEKEQEELQKKIDKLANDPKFVKKWRMTTYGEKNKETGEYEIKSWMPEVAKMVGLQFGVKNSADILKKTKIVPFDRSDVKGYIKKGKRSYSSKASGLAYAIHPNKDDLTEKEEQNVEGGVWKDRRIGLNQYSGNTYSFDFGEFFYDPHEEHRKKMDELDKKYKKKYDELRDNMVEQKRDEMKNDPQGFSKWREDVADSEFREMIAPLEQEEKEQRQKLIESYAEDLANFDTRITSTILKDELVAEGMEKAFVQTEERMPKKLRNLFKQRKQEIEASQVWSEREKQKIIKELKDYYTVDSPAKGLTQEQCDLRNIATHEWMHTIAKHEEPNYKGGVDRGKLNFLHEGMTEWLTRQVIFKNPEFYSTNEQIKKGKKPQVWSYEPHVAYADLMDTLFPGSVDALYFNGKDVAFDEKYASKHAMFDKIRGERFSVANMIQLYGPLQAFQKYENGEDLDDEHEERVLDEMSSNFFTVKDIAKQMLDAGEISKKQYDHALKSIQKSWDEVHRKVFDYPDIDFSKEQEFLLSKVLKNANYTMQDIVKGKSFLYELFGGSVLGEIYAGNYQIVDGQVVVAGHIVPEQNYKKFFDPQTGLTKIPCVEEKDSKKVITLSSVLPASKMGQKMLDENEIDALKKDANISGLDTPKVFVLKDGTVAFAENLADLKMNGFDVSNAVRVSTMWYKRNDLAPAEHCMEVQAVKVDYDVKLKDGADKNWTAEKGPMPDEDFVFSAYTSYPNAANFRLSPEQTRAILNHARMNYAPFDLVGLNGEMLFDEGVVKELSKEEQETLPENNYKTQAELSSVSHKLKKLAKNVKQTGENLKTKFTSNKTQNNDGPTFCR